MLIKFMNAMAPNVGEYDRYSRELDEALREMEVSFTPNVIVKIMALYELLCDLNAEKRRDLLLHFWKKPKAIQWILLEILMYCKKNDVNVYSITDRRLEWIRSEITEKMLDDIHAQMLAKDCADVTNDHQLLLKYKQDLVKLSRNVRVDTDHSFLSTNQLQCPKSGKMLPSV